MSAWLLFTAMGFYPVNPASGEYMIGSPMYPRVSIRLQTGRPSASSRRMSQPGTFTFNLQRLTENLNHPIITWEQIQSGATLRFRMGPKPSRWGSDWQPFTIPSR